MKEEKQARLEDQESIAIHHEFSVLLGEKLLRELRELKDTLNSLATYIRERWEQDDRDDSPDVS